MYTPVTLDTVLARMYLLLDKALISMQGIDLKTELFCVVTRVLAVFRMTCLCSSHAKMHSLITRTR